MKPNPTNSIDIGDATVDTPVQYTNYLMTSVTALIREKTEGIDSKEFDRALDRIDEEAVYMEMGEGKPCTLLIDMSAEATPLFLLNRIEGKARACVDENANWPEILHYIYVAKFIINAETENLPPITVDIEYVLEKLVNLDVKLIPHKTIEKLYHLIVAKREASIGASYVDPEDLNLVCWDEGHFYVSIPNRAPNTKINLPAFFNAIFEKYCETEGWTEIADTALSIKQKLAI